ncbi:MAG: mechanosensitive ion channel domain-containing protein [Pseudomonadota bacterium]
MNQQTETALSAAIREASGLLAEYAFSVLGAIVILILGFFIAGVISRWARNALMRVEAIDSTLSAFLSNIVKYAIWVLVLVTVLAQFGVQTTSIIAALGAAGLAIGLALQGTLANIAAGIMMLILRPFRVGEYIESGDTSGTVQEIGLFTTELKQADGLFVMTPNSQLWNTSIVNYSRNDRRRVELVVGISYDDDMAEAREELLGLAKADERVLKDPAPIAFVNSLDDSSVGIGMRLWVNTADYLALTWDLTEAAKRRFDEVGISLPYPQREIRQLAD